MVKYGLKPFCKISPINSATGETQEPAAIRPPVRIPDITKN
jgi:hypothetical protein